MSLSLTDADLERISSELGNVRPSLSEGLGAALETGFEGTTLGSLATLGREVQGARRDPTPLTREEWQASGLSRERMTYEEGMTRGQAEAMARTFDAQQARNRVMQARDPGALETALQFGAQIAGNIPDPANLLPFVGVARMGLTAARGATAGAALLTESAGLARVSGAMATGAATLGGRGVGAGVARGVTDAVLGNLAVAPLVYGVQERYGEDVTFGTVMRDLSIGALIGAGFGAAAGALGRGSDPKTAVRVLDAVAGDIAAGRAAEVPMPLVRASVEDAVMRSAPAELQGVRLADLPVGPDGAPVSRAEFEAWAMRREEPGIRYGETEKEFNARMGEEDTAAAAALPPDVQDMLRTMRRSGAIVPQGEVSLSSFLADLGGIRNEGEGRNLWQLMGGDAEAARVRPGLFSNQRRPSEGFVSSVNVEQAFESAKEAGYLKTGTTLDEFYTAVVDDATGARKIYGLTEDAKGRERAAAADDMERALSEKGMGIHDTDAAIARALGYHEARVASGEEDFSWYQEAISTREHLNRMAAAPTPREAAPREAPPAAERTGEDPDTAAAMRQIEAIRAAGRLSPGDDAILRAGAEQADEIEAAANGLEEAGECLLRNLA